MANTLPDDVFREIFAFYLSSHYVPYDPHGYMTHQHMTAWQRLVHVCQRWRDIIYGSPCYFDLHLYCSYHTPFRKNLGRWPEFPLNLQYDIYPANYDHDDDVVAALEHPDRVHRANLIISAGSSDSMAVEDMLEVMQVPFLALTHLDFALAESKYETLEEEEIFLPDEFLGGSAPRLQHLCLKGISFPALPKLLLSARGLISLQLERATLTTRDGYVSPEELVEGLAGLTKLKTLRIEFDSPEDAPYDEQLDKRRRQDLPIHVLLPALSEFAFKGSSWYLEDLVTPIDAPHVKDIEIDYLSRDIEASQLSRFIGRTTNFKFAQFRRAQLMTDFKCNEAGIELYHPQGECHEASFLITMSSSDEEFDDLVPCITRVLGRLVAILSDVGQLFLDDDGKEEYYLDNTEWLPLLHLFPAVETLHVTGWIAWYIAAELEDIAEERVTEVLPALHSLWLGGGDELAASRFLSLRQVSGRPVTVVNMQDESK